MAAAFCSWPTTTCSYCPLLGSWMSIMTTSLFAVRSSQVTALITLCLLREFASAHQPKPGLVLNDFIKHFEPLYYEQAHVREQHERVRRNVDDTIRFQFHAHNRRFQLYLRPVSQDLFADNFVVENTEGPINVQIDNVYSGSLKDDDQSEVHGIITADGLFDGTISTATEEYYVEPASRYAPQLDFPAIIYKVSDVIPPWQLSSSSSSDSSFLDAPHCASHELHLKRRESFLSDYCHDAGQCHESFMQTLPRANLSHTPSPSVIPPPPPPPSRRRRQQRQKREPGGGTWTIDHEWNANETSQWKKANGQSFRRRRTIDPKKVTCMLYLQADHLFYQKLGSEEACIESMTRHVQRVNAIYKKIDFNGDGQPDNLTFMIKRIKVHTDKALQDPKYRFPGNYGVEKFLELFSEEDYDAFCLAYMFTYRDFEGGTLGLAWTGDLKNAGGVCEKNGHYRGSLKSLNTGIVTLLNYGKHVPPAVSHVTLAHEIGHNFGSPHDPENNKECTPGGEDGNYIMFARATSGDKKNNNDFSPCSLKSINSVLNSKARDDKGCFKEPQTAICGNGVVEVGEECDCGWEEDCKELCCNPMRTSPKLDYKPCSLRPNRICSPSQGPCCTNECELRSGVKCRDDNGCRDSSFCDGRGPVCPPANNKPNKTICNEEFVCFMGECTGSICIAYGLESCQCSQGSGDPPTKACELCCKQSGDDQPCLSSFDWNTLPYDVPDKHAKPGTPCNNYNGYCDVFNRCREVDPSGPLATLRRLLLSDESIASLKKWVEEHWYGVLFIAIGFIVFMVVIVRLFGKKRSKTTRVRRTSRPRKSAALAALPNGTAGGATTEEGDPSSGHVVHPAAVRAHLPFKKKVREKSSHGRSRHASRKKSVRPEGGANTSRSVQLLCRLLGRSTLSPLKAKKPRSSANGALSSAEKVMSWLEREDPPILNLPRASQTQPNLQRSPSSHETAGNDLPSQETRLLACLPNEGPVVASLGDKPPKSGLAPKPKGMGRSVSENPQRRYSARFESPAHDSTHETAVAPPSFTRSHSHMAKSQSHHPNPGKLFRKSESQSQLLMSRSRSLSTSQSHSPKDSSSQSGSKKDLVNPNLEDLEPETDTFNPPSLSRMESQVQLIPPSTDELPRKRKTSSSSSQAPKPAAVMPSVKSQRILPKSATDSKLKAMLNAPVGATTSGGVAKRASSLDMLNIFKSRPSLPAGGGACQNPASRPPQNRGKDVAKRKGAGTTLGLGPVRVVLKWHGKSSAGARRKKPSTSGTGSDKKKRQVIVYSNPEPTLADKNKKREKLVSKDAKEDLEEGKGRSKGEASRKLIHITDNPLDRHDLVNPGYTPSPEPERSRKISNNALRATSSDTSSSGHISIHMDSELEHVDC